ncbi:two-component system sensor histidine kinase NtrB [Antarctobacter heliothermus]|uniref:histidine kinase n=1 Tax=Antarctobacter heliothermus TaxID=74033 RepID=A0A222DZC3_9RHOB|nr:PAS domain S-box protein [Antarctobacter heliothermus]ASP19252.1 two-component system sensor histidine kinase NtrB [Antarctobacter heliothermus]
MATVAASVFFLSVQRGIQTERLVSETRVVGSSFAARLETHVATRLKAGEFLGLHFVRNGVFENNTFQTQATLLHELFGDFQALNWVDAQGVIRIVTPEAGNTQALDLNLHDLPIPSAALARAAETGEMQVTPPIALAQGGQGFVVYVPVAENAQRSGFLNIVFRTAPLMKTALEEEAGRSYAFRVLDGEEVFFSSEQDADFDTFAHESRITVGNREWRLLTAPTPARVRDTSSMIDEAILVFGCLLAALTGFLSRLVIDRQRSLQHSRTRFEDYASASSDWFWEMDETLRITWFSTGLEDFLGVSREQLIGRARGDFRDTEAGDDDHWAAHFDDLAARRSFRDFLYPIRIDDQRKWLRLSGAPRFDDNGRFKGYRGTATDTTELIRSKSEVEQANARLAEAVEGLVEVFSLWDDEDRLVFGNQAFRDLNKTIPEYTVPGTRFESYLRAGVDDGHMPDLEGHEDDFMARSLVQRYDPNAGPFEIERSDGIILRLHEQKLKGGGIATVGLDVTTQRRNEEALRKSQERLALAVQQLSIWDWELRTDKLYMSPGFATHLGYTAEEFEEIKAASITSIIHPDDVERYRAKLKAHIEDPRSIFSNEHQFRTKSGAYKWFLAIGQTIVDDTGAAIRSTGVLTDITERVELESQLRQAQKMEAIGNLTGGVAHDFNNLLAVILGNLELIKEAEDVSSIAPFVTAGIEATNRGADLVRSMLGFARRSRLQPMVVDLNALLQETETWFGRALPENVDVDIALAPDLWPIETDPSLAQNAVLNLVLNARDAMPSGGSLMVETANVTLGADDLDDDDGESIAPGRYVTVAITDTGEGIPHDRLNAVFQPFFTTKPPGSGSGLGLSMVQGFMKQSGGMVRVSSDPGVATTFKLFFPAVIAQSSAPAVEADKTLPRSAPMTRILLVEDEDAVRGVLAETLSRAGYTVRTARSGDAALADWEQDHDFDLLITDIVMPGQHQGTDLARKLRENRPDFPVVFLSGYAKETAIPDNALKPNDVRLMKPVSRLDLFAAIETALAEKAKGRPLSPVS